MKQFVNGVILSEIEVEHLWSVAVEGLGGKGITDVLTIAQRRDIMI